MLDQLEISLVVSSLDSQMDDRMIEFHVGRVDGNLPRDPDPIVDQSQGAFRPAQGCRVMQTKSNNNNI